jgi:dephospho-CoA kinase
VTENTKQSPFRIGLTGGIASGKSTVADLFLDLGAKLIDTDVIARVVVKPCEPAVEEIRRRFGDDVVDKSGALDRATMRNLAFSDDKSRSDLEAILHPRIGAEVRRQSQSVDGMYQIIVVPLLVDSPLLQFVERVLVIDCNEDEQLARLLKRDSGTAEEAKRILAAQSSREERLEIADDVISNNSDLAHLREQVIVLDENYRRLSMLAYRRER